MLDVARPDSVDPRALRHACGKFATGVTVVTTRTPDGDHGMTVSAFMSVSLDPPLICVSLNRRSKMAEKVRVSGRYAVNVLSREMQSHAMHFAGRPDATLTNLFDERQGLPVLRDAAAIVVADVVEQIEAGDHVLVLGHVRDLECSPVAPPLIYHSGQFGDWLPTSPMQGSSHP
jgi:flavin reductase (DIM6/NTAB) family NADH-FMN oxidoreductase RutF